MRFRGCSLLTLLLLWGISRGDAIAGGGVGDGITGGGWGAGV